MVPEDLSVDSCNLPRCVHCHPARHDSLELQPPTDVLQLLIWFEDVVDFFYVGKATIDHEIEMSKVTLQLKHPWVLQRWDRAVLFGIKAFQESFASVDDELGDAAHF